MRYSALLNSLPICLIDSVAVGDGIAEFINDGVVVFELRNVDSRRVHGFPPLFILALLVFTDGLPSYSRKYKRQALTNYSPIQASYCGLSHLQTVML